MVPFISCFSASLGLPQVHLQASDLLLSILQLILEVILSPVKICDKRVVRSKSQMYKTKMTVMDEVEK
jgi:hypothetical protein